jgi:hypothetical protein
MGAKTVHVGEGRAKEFEKDPARHYTLVERESAKVPEYDSPYDDMVSQGGGYRVESDDRTVTGNRRLVLVSCPIEDHLQRLQDATKEANERITADDNITPAGLEGSAEAAFDSNKKGAALSLDQLPKAVGTDAVGA